MSGTVNSVFIIGNLGADPDVRTTPSGQMVANLSIATSESFTNREGQRQERTEWHRVQVWAKTAELAQRYLAKGAKVCVQGRIQTRSWDDPQTGTKRYSTEIVGERLTFLDRAPGSGAGSDTPRGSQQGPGPAPKGNRPAPQGNAPGGSDEPAYFDDDVPF